MNSRRTIVVKALSLLGASAVLPRSALADIPVLTENDPMALAMGFRLHTADANQAKYPKHALDQSCAKCMHFTVPGAKSAKCDLFNKIVPMGGWCSGFTRRK